MAKGPTHTDHQDEVALEFRAAINGTITLRGTDVPYREIDALESGDGSIRARIIADLNQYIVELVRDHLAGYEFRSDDDVESFDDPRSEIAYGVQETEIQAIETRHLTIESKREYVKGLDS